MMFSQDKVAEQKTICQILNLINQVENIREKSIDGGNNDIVAFMGLTKSGKSTLINGLMGTPLKCMKNPLTEDTYIVKTADDGGPAIGAECGESETVDPTSYGNLPGTNLVMWDFPGFGDNKGPDQEILNAVSYQKILRTQKSVRFVVVASQLLIKNDNPLPFYSLLYQLEQVCPQIAEMLCIVCTKFERGTVKGLLENCAAIKFPHAEDNQRTLISRSQQIISKVLEKESFIDIKAPRHEDVDKPFILSNKNQIVDIIRKLKGTAINDVPLLISQEAKLRIADFYNVAYFIVKKKVDATCEAITKYFDSEGINKVEGSAVEKLAIYKNVKMSLEKVLEKSKDFESFFTAIEDIGMGKEFANDIAMFEFVEQLKYMYKIDDKEELPKGKLEFLDTLLLCLKNNRMQYITLIASSEAIRQDEKRKEEELMRKQQEELEKLREAVNRLRERNSKPREKSFDDVLEDLLGIQKYKKNSAPELDFVKNILFGDIFKPVPICMPEKKEIDGHVKSSIDHVLSGAAMPFVPKSTIATATHSAPAPIYAPERNTRIPLPGPSTSSSDNCILQ